MREALEAKTAVDLEACRRIDPPELRPLILFEALPNGMSYQMLVNDLPKFKGASSRNLDQRILLSLSQLRKTTPDEEACQCTRSVRHQDAHTVMCGEEVEAPRSKIGWWRF